MAKETNRIDIYQAVTDDILAMLEAGTKPWVKPCIMTSICTSIISSHDGLGDRMSSSICG